MLFITVSALHGEGIPVFSALNIPFESEQKQT